MPNDFFMFYIVSCHRKLIDFKMRSGGGINYESLPLWCIPLKDYDPTSDDKSVGTFRFFRDDLNLREVSENGFRVPWCGQSCFSFCEQSTLGKI